jgi:Na+-driven multidrug efflux pump
MPWDVGRLMERIAALSGSVAVALLFVYIAAGAPEGDPEDPASAIAAAMAENQESARVAAYVGLAAAFALLWFVAYLHGQLRRAEGDEGWLATVALGGGLMAIALLLVEVSFTLAESTLASYDADTQVAKTYLIYHWWFASVLAPGLSAMVAASTLVGWRFGALPRWLNWLGTVIVVLMLLAVTQTPGLAAALGILWILPASIALCLRVGRPRPLRTASNIV